MTISKIFKILGSKFTLIGILVLLSFLFLRQCDATRNAKNESDRNFRNYKAQGDSILYLKSRFGNSIAEKTALELKYKELSDEQKNIIAELELERNKKPSVIVRTRIIYRDSTIEVPVYPIFISGSTLLAFNYNPELPTGNTLDIAGKIPYKLELDSILDSLTGKYKMEPKLYTSNAQLDIEQTIALTTGLYRNPKDGMLYVRATTSFPGITFVGLEALNIIDDPATKKALRNARKQFGIGINVGYGATMTKTGYSTGPTINAGVYYSPRWLQFGK